MFGDISVVAFLLSFVALPSGIVVGLIARRSIARRAPQELRGKAVATAAAIVGAVVLLLLVAMTWTRGFNLD